MNEVRLGQSIDFMRNSDTLHFQIISSFMSEALSQLSESPEAAVNRVLVSLRELHIQSAEERTDEERIAEGMSSQIIGETTQRALQALIEVEAAKLRTQEDAEGWDAARCTQEIAAMRQRLTADIFKEHWFESTLSKADHPIHAATYGTSMFRYDLRMLMTENPSPERIDEFAWIMLDANGLRSFKDCTSHDETTHYLQGVVRILVNEESPTRKKLAALGIRAIPMATGGDEFVLYLRGKKPITQQIIDDTVISLQTEISENKELQSMLNFDDEGVLKQYAMPSSAERKKFDKMDPADRTERLRTIRATLPDAFTPSFAGGGALMRDGMLKAIERDELDLKGDDETFHTLREKIVQATIELAELRQKKNKEAGLKKLEVEDPKTFEFRLRNGESRKLHAQKMALVREIEEFRRRVELLMQEGLAGEELLRNTLNEAS